MSVISPSSISNVSLVPIANHTGKTNSSTRFSFSRKPTKHTFHNQRFLLPLSTSVRLFPNCTKNLFCSHGRRIRIFSATGTDVAVEESDSPVSGEESTQNSELTSGAISTNEETPVKSDVAPTQTKRSRPVRKSEMPAVNNEELIPGATFTGKVRSIQPFGAFVDFGAFTDGLVHVSRLSDSYVKDVASVVSVGQEVKVRLIEANAEAGRISLSMRENDERKESPASNDKPGSSRKSAPKARGPRRDEVKKSSNFVKGQDLQGTVKNITRSGAFISLPEGEEGFLPSSEETFEGFGNLMGGSTLEIGQEVNVRVLRIARGRVTLTMKKDEDNDKSDSQFIQGKVYAATNPFLLAFRKNNDIATFLDERESIEEAANKSVVQKVTEIVEGIVDADQIEADDKVEKSVPPAVDEAVKEDEPERSADSSAVAQDDSKSILSTSEGVVDGVVDAENKEAEGNSEIKASDDNQLPNDLAVDKSEVLDDSSSDVLVTQDEGESTLSTSDNIVDAVTDTTEKKAGESSEVKQSEDEQSEEVRVVEAAQPIDGPETDGQVAVPDDEANKLVSSESSVSEELVAGEDSVAAEKESEQSRKDLENEIVSASSSEKEEDKPESDSNGSITSLGQSGEEVAESQVDIESPAENPEVVSSAPVIEEKIATAPERSADPPEEVAPKAAISPALVKQLRDDTGAGMMDCKKALAESGGDIAKAQEFLRKKGLASAEKKASRATAEGRIGSYIHDGRIGVLIEVNCETDFVSRGDIFKELVDDLAMQVAACPQVQYVVTEDVPEEIVNKEREVEMQKEDLLSKPEQIRSRIVEGRIGKRLEELALLEQPYIKNDKIVLKDWVKQTIATIGENMKVKRFVRYNLGEGLEKKSQDFAAEVAAQTAAKPAAAPAVKEEQPSVEEAKETAPKAAAVAVPAALVKKLREETGAGMMDCKKALSETGGDLEKAQEYLRKKGLSSADKKSSRLAAEGRIGSYIHDSRIGVLIEVNCEREMASMAQQFTGLRCAPLSSSRLSKPFSSKHFLNKSRSLPVQAAVISGPIPSPQTRERFKLKEVFEEAYERCRNAPVEGISFTLEDFHAALEKYDFDSELGTKVKGTVFCTDNNGALVDITAKSSAYLPLQEACIHRIKHVEEAGVFPGLREEFVIIGENESDDSLILSLRSIQYDLAWERCRQLQAEDVVVKGKVVDANKGGVVAVVEGLRGFVPFSQISTKSNAEELLSKELPLKFVEVDEEQSRLVLSNRKAMADSQAQLGIGSVVTGTVQSLKPYGAFIDIGGINGLLHVSQISHDRISDIATVLQPGDSLKVMILSHDRERGRVSLSTKKLEPTPGDMIRNPKLVFEKAEEMAQTFRQRIAQAEALARADMLRFQPESGLTLTTDGILGPITPELPVEGLDLNDVPPAEE